MANEAEDAAHRLSALVAEIEAEAYARGKADARGEFLAALGRAEQLASMLRPARKRRTAGRRAPRGATRGLVARALDARPGLSARQILEFAETDAERLVKLDSIRVELRYGGLQGWYRASDGRWSLVVPAAAVGAGVSEEATPRDPGETSAAPADASRSQAGPSPEPYGAGSAAADDTPDGDAESREAETGVGRGKLGMNW